MANRPPGFGLTAEVKERIAAKYDLGKEQEARQWIEAVLKEPLDNDTPADTALGQDKMHEVLQSGIILCRVAAEVTDREINTNSGKIPFHSMENINKFLEACVDYGVQKGDLFQTVDLYEKENMWSVICAIHALGRKARSNGYTGPTLGPNEAKRNPRQFSSEQMEAGKNVIGLQMGAYRAKSAGEHSGIVFDKRRPIMDWEVGRAAISDLPVNKDGVDHSDVIEEGEENGAEDETEAADENEAPDDKEAPDEKEAEEDGPIENDEEGEPAAENEAEDGENEAQEGENEAGNEHEKEAEENENEAGDDAGDEGEAETEVPENEADEAQNEADENAGEEEGGDAVVDEDDAEEKNDDVDDKDADAPEEMEGEGADDAPEESAEQEGEAAEEPEGGDDEEGGGEGADEEDGVDDGEKDEETPDGTEPSTEPEPA